MLWILIALLKPVVSNDTHQGVRRNLGTCNATQYVNPANSSACLSCNAACNACNGPNAYNCLGCSSNYSMIQGICLNSCPLGFKSVSGACTSLSVTGVVFNPDFTTIGNYLLDKAMVYPTPIVLVSGSSYSNYPNFDVNDPYPVIQRGYYFRGTSYVYNGDYSLTFGPAFTLGMWIYPTQGTSYLFSKQYSSNTMLGISINNYVPIVSLYLNSVQTFQSSYSLNSTSWNFIMIKVSFVSYSTSVSITVGTQTSILSSLSTYFSDATSNFNVAIGSMVSNNAYTSFYTGYIWSFVLYNQLVTTSAFILTSGCSGCSICPVGNSNECLSNCTYTQYPGNNTCFNCSSSCQAYGCVRNDTACNLCSDQKCTNCTSLVPKSCIKCISTAYLKADGTCSCNPNYLWDSVLINCRPCSDYCYSCDGGGYLGCSSCKSGYYMISGICVAFCPTGYTPVGGSCAASSTRVFNLVLNKIQGVVYDTASNIPVVTGSTSAFYPYYEPNDPLASLNRGYYFKGTSFMHFAPYSAYTGPSLSFAPVFYIGFWINPSLANGIIYSNTSPSNSTILQISLISSKPSITLLIYNPSASPTYPSYTCKNLMNTNAWGYVVFVVTLDSHERTYVTCVINMVSDSAYFMGQGHFSDTTQGNVMILGSSPIGPVSFSSNAYQGFIYMMVVDVNLNTPNAGITSSCGGLCSVCPYNGTCLSGCSLSSYQSGASPYTCSPCNSSCSSLGCVNNNSSCNLCLDPTCLVCPDFVTSNCTLYNCTAGLYRTYAMATCQACDSSCATCSNAGPVSCLSCNANYLLNGACHSFCPTGYTLIGGTCQLSLSLIVNLDLLDILGVITDSQSGFKVIAGSTTAFYPNFDANDPWPIQSRGYYFYVNSYLQFPPNSADTTTLTLGNQFTFSVWINSISSGVLFSKVGSSSNIYLSIGISTYISVSLNLNTLVTAVSTLGLNSNWNYVGISVTYQSDGNTGVVFYVNTNSEHVTLVSGHYNDITGNCIITVGALKTSAGYSNYWTGTLYMFKVYSQALSPLDYTSACDNSVYSCALCPYSTGACIETCSYGTWWNGTSCRSCNNCNYESCVRQDTGCNLCYDVQCLVCSSFNSGSCTQCQANANLYNGTCTCNTYYVWSNLVAGCSYCNPYINKVILHGACLSGCPTGYLAGSAPSFGYCVGTSQKIFEARLDNIVQGNVMNSLGGSIALQTGISSLFYPQYEYTDPYAIESRGYYFNGYSSYMIFITDPSNQNQLVLSPKFSIGFWAFPTTHGVLFSRQSKGALGLVLEITPSNNILLSISFSGFVSYHVSVSNVTLSSWNYIGITLSVLSDSSTTLVFTINTVIENSYKIGLSPYLDFQSGYTCVIGGSYNQYLQLSNYYTGYIRSISVWNTDQNLIGEVITSCKGNCNICPGTGLCLSDCEYTSYINNTCQACNQNCTAGCVRPDDCNLCYDRLCGSCSDYTPVGCTECVDGASFISNVCYCTSGPAKAKTNGNLYCSTQCMSYCATCTSSNNGDCTSCSSGYYLSTEGLCVTSCPTGYIIKNNNCILNNTANEILHYIFTKTINNQPDLTNNFVAFMGSASNYLGNFDNNDPIPVYQRGIYFYGSGQYASLPPNVADSRSIVFGNTHTIKVWIRPGIQSGYSSILVKESDTSKSLYLYLDQTLTPYIYYKVQSIQDGSIANFTASGVALITGVWQELIVLFLRSSQSTTATIYTNGSPGMTSYKMDSFIYEYSSDNFKIGYSVTSSASYFGFIYELVVYNYITVIPVPVPCSYGIYTESGTCISNCTKLQCIDQTESCISCPSSCSSGYAYRNFCLFNEDPLCLKSVGFNHTDCYQCVPLAVGFGKGCSCGNYTVASDFSCACIPQYENINNTCVKCYHRLNSSDIQVYFNPDYLSLTFQFNYSVQAGLSSDCNDLFTNTTVKLFGSSPVCTWGSDYMSLMVVLGESPTVYIYDTLTFNGNKLISYLVMCGSSLASVSIHMTVKYGPPPIYPNCIIRAPYEFYLPLGNLEITAKYSKGGYGRALKYLWFISSYPAIPDLTVGTDLSQSSLEFLNKTLSNTTITATLTIANWLGYSDTKWRTIIILTNDGLRIGYDQNVTLEIDSQTPVSLYVDVDNRRTKPGSQTYTWSVEALGVGAYVNRSLVPTFSKPSCKLYILPGALAPGTYDFKVDVYNKEINLGGVTVITIYVTPSPLKLAFHPPFITYTTHQDLILDGSIAIDPDNLQGNMSYNWTCYNTSDCSNIITNRTSEVSLVLKDLLMPKTIYEFSLFVSKDTRNITNNFTVSTYFNGSLSVKFDDFPLYINNQENYAIHANLNRGCNCKFIWNVTPYISFYNNTLDLGIVPGSLVPGKVYNVSLTVIDEFGNITVAKDSFSADVYPTGGDFYADSSQGLELYTLFTLYAPNWYDPRDSSLLLTYQFGYYLNNQTFHVNVRNSSSVYTTYLPAGDPLTVFLRVYNIYGSYSERSIKVTVEPVYFNTTSFILWLSDILYDEMTDPYTFPGIFNAFGLHMLSNNSINASDLYDYNATSNNQTDLYGNYSILSNNSINITDLYAGYNISIHAINVLMNSIVDFDYGKIDILLQMANITAYYDIDPGNKTEVYDILGNITKLINNNSVSVNSLNFKSFADILNGLSPFNYSTVTGNSKGLYNMDQVFKTLANAACQTIGQGQNITFSTPYLDFHFKLYKGDELLNFTTPSEFNRSYISLPNDPLLKFNSSETILLFLSVYNAQTSYNTTSEYSSAVEFSLFKIENSVQVPLELYFNGDRINITIPVSNLQVSRPLCGYWTGTEWSGDGCSLIDVYMNSSICSCTHMSLYSTGSYLVTSSYSYSPINNSPIVVYITSAIIFLWIVSTCFLVVKDRNDNDNQIYDEDMISESEINSGHSSLHETSKEKKNSAKDRSYSKVSHISSKEKASPEVSEFKTVQPLHQNEVSQKKIKEKSLSYYRAEPVKVYREVKESEVDVDENVNEDDKSYDRHRTMVETFKKVIEIDIDKQVVFGDNERKIKIYDLEQEENPIEIKRPQDLQNITEKPDLLNKKKISHTLEEEKEFESNIPQNSNKITENPEVIGDQKEIQNLSFVEEYPTKYSVWVVNYYFSGFLIYHFNYTRFARLSQSVSSLMLQIMSIGIVINILGSSYAQNILDSLEFALDDTIYKQFAVLFSIVLGSNLVTSFILIYFFKEQAPGKEISENESILVEENYECKVKIGIGLVVLMVFGIFASATGIELYMTPNESQVWGICFLLMLIIDFVLIQFVKMAIYIFPCGKCILPTD